MEVVDDDYYDGEGNECRWSETILKWEKSR